MAGSWLHHALTTIHELGWSPKLAKGLQWQALEVDRAAWGRPPMPQKAGATEVVVDIERACSKLEGLAASAGAKVKIGEAKRWLRDAGSPELASRVARLGRARHSEAHPDPGLVQAVQRFASEYQIGQSESGSLKASISTDSADLKAATDISSMEASEGISSEDVIETESRPTAVGGPKIHARAHGEGISSEDASGIMDVLGGTNDKYMK